MGGRGGDSAGLPASTVQFEWDPGKSAANKLKHGIDFDQARALWQDPNRVVTASGYMGPESRHLTIGHLDGKMYTAVFTMRGDIIRIISVRRARTQEEANYGRTAVRDQHGRV